MSVVHYWNLRDPVPSWECRAGYPHQGQEHRQTTDPNGVTCLRCLRRMPAFDYGCDIGANVIVCRMPRGPRIWRKGGGR